MLNNVVCVSIWTYSNTVCFSIENYVDTLPIGLLPVLAPASHQLQRKGFNEKKHSCGLQNLPFPWYILNTNFYTIRNYASMKNFMHTCLMNIHASFQLQVLTWDMERLC